MILKYYINESFKIKLKDLNNKIILFKINNIKLY